MCGIAELREDGDDISFRKVKWKAAHVNPCCVAVVDVPAGGGWYGVLEFALVEESGLSDGIHAGLFPWVDADRCSESKVP